MHLDRLEKEKELISYSIKLYILSDHYYKDIYLFNILHLALLVADLKKNLNNLKKKFKKGWNIGSRLIGLSKSFPINIKMMGLENCHTCCGSVTKKWTHNHKG